MAKETFSADDFEMIIASAYLALDDSGRAGMLREMSELLNIPKSPSKPTLHFSISREDARTIWAESLQR